MPRQTASRGAPYAYDLNGNMTNDGLNSSMVYDAENRLVTLNSSAATYSYDANSLRVKKVASGTTTVYIFSGAKVIAEYDNGAAVGSPSREYIYSGGALVAKIEGSTANYFHQDHPSNRLVTDSTGTVVENYAFGEAWYEGATPNKLKFTSYERDAESANDYAMARFNVNRLRRFSSPDPIAVPRAISVRLSAHHCFTHPAKRQRVAQEPASAADAAGTDRRE
jgi:hypothetical protein